jgi:hypothetical protein
MDPHCIISYGTRWTTLCTMHWESDGICCALQVTEQGKPPHSMQDLCSYRDLCLLCTILFLQKSKGENTFNSHKIHVFPQILITTLKIFPLSYNQVFNKLLLTTGTVCAMVLLSWLFLYGLNAVYYVGFVFLSLAYFT